MYSSHGEKPIAVAGIDIGSLWTKAVVVDKAGGILGRSTIKSGAAYADAGEQAFAEALGMSGLSASSVRYVVGTGYGRERVEFANEQISEITCHGMGAKRLIPETTVVVDIGGQDSKVIRVNGTGRPLSFMMNDKCAAGTGRFLEVMAAALGVELKDLGELASRSNVDLEVSSICTVFAESEVISLFARGCQKADIAAAIHKSIARRIVPMLAHVGLKKDDVVTMTGGVARNSGVVRALGALAHVSPLVPEEPQIVGAYGAGILAIERLRDGAPKRS